MLFTSPVFLLCNGNMSITLQQSEQLFLLPFQFICYEYDLLVVCHYMTISNVLLLREIFFKWGNRYRSTLKLNGDWKWHGIVITNVYYTIFLLYIQNFPKISNNDTFSKKKKIAQENSVTESSVCLEISMSRMSTSCHFILPSNVSHTKGHIICEKFGWKKQNWLVKI